MGTVHRDQEQVAPPGTVGRIGMGSVEKMLVLQEQAGQIAGPRAENGDPGRLRLIRLEAQTAFGIPAGGEQGFPGREHMGFEGVRRCRPGEQALVVLPLQTIAARLLLVTPAPGQFLDGGDRFVTDDAVAHHRAVHVIAGFRERIDQPLAIGCRQELRLCHPVTFGRHRAPPSRRA